jgi:hypothetical protein
MDEIAVGKLTDIADGDYRVFAVEELEVGIFRTGSKVLAYENVCPHAGGPVCQGKIFNRLPVARLRIRSRHRLPSRRSLDAADAGESRCARWADLRQRAQIIRIK